MPEKHFPGQKDDEIIKCIVRKHWVIFIFLFIKAAMLVVVPAAIMAFLIFDRIIPESYQLISTAFFLLYLLFAYTVVYIGWQNEELDTVIITNERIVNIDQVSFLHRTISETSLAHLSDVRGQQKGIFGDLLNYGMVELFSGNHKSLSKIQYVGVPFKIAEEILEARNEFFLKHSSVEELKHPHEKNHSLYESFE